MPVKLRRGGRILGGSLSWDKPQQLAGFSRESPFNGMTVPTDVTVTRQVLAEPDSQLTDRTWATLADGTPLVTAERRGKGLLILFHVTADTRWSDRSHRRLRLRVRYPAISPNAAASIIRRGFTGRPKAWSRSTHWRLPIAPCRSMLRRSTPASMHIGMVNRSTCGDRSSSLRLRCSCSMR